MSRAEEILQAANDCGWAVEMSTWQDQSTETTAISVGRPGESNGWCEVRVSAAELTSSPDMEKLLDLSAQNALRAFLEPDHRWKAAVLIVDLRDEVAWIG